MDSRPGLVRYTYYHNPVFANRVGEQILGRIYKLIDSQAVGDLLEVADATLKPFEIEFQDTKLCNFSQGEKLTVLEYEVSDQGEITFRDPKKKNQRYNIQSRSFGLADDALYSILIVQK